MQKILIVEDDSDIQELLENHLIGAGYSVVSASDGVEALSHFSQHAIDLVLLDIMLPKIDGYGVCELIRKQSQVPIVMLTALDSETDQIKGLDLQIDDYITKPFSPREIVYRIKAQLRRQQYQSDKSKSLNDLLAVGSLTLDKESCRIYKRGQEIELTGREFLLLSYLMENADKIISKERLYEQVWGEYSCICDNTIMVHIRHIREKIEDTPSAPKQLITIKGLGYKLKKRTD